jgi:hypothetical protein
MTTEQTPGEWSVGSTIAIAGQSYIAIEDSGPECPCIVALVTKNYTDGKNNHAPANAELIAGAPRLKADKAELISALTVAVKLLKVCADDSEEAGYPSRAESVRAHVKAFKSVLAGCQFKPQPTHAQV